MRLFLCVAFLVSVSGSGRAAAAPSRISPDSLTLAPVPVVPDTAAATVAPESTFVMPVTSDSTVLVKVPIEAAPVTATKERRVERPYRVVLRSLVYPGWGQMYNGKPYKALAMFVSEGGLLGMIYREWREASKAYDAHLTEPDDTKAAELYSDYERHFARQESYTWWAVGLVLFSLADAYVDANLITFDDEFGDTKKGGSGGGGPNAGKPQTKVGVSFQPDQFSAGGFVCLKYGF